MAHQLNFNGNRRGIKETKTLQKGMKIKKKLKKKENRTNR